LVVDTRNVPSFWWVLARAEKEIKKDLLGVDNNFIFFIGETPLG